jgi:hypothetical protein
MERIFVIKFNNMNIFKKLVLFILLAPLVSLAQQTKQIDPNVEQQKIEDFFDKNTPWKTTKDSSAIYAFSFKVNVTRDNKGIARVTSLTASDSIAYEIYPKYKHLETINYGVFMENKKTATFIIPVALEVFNSKGDNIAKTDFLKDSMSLFNLEQGDNNKIKNYIYIKLIVYRINKQVFD